jgi:hypothetical protein
MISETGKVDLHVGKRINVRQSQSPRKSVKRPAVPDLSAGKQWTLVVACLTA